MAVLRLVDQGKLNLDTDVNQYLQSWKLPTNEFTAKTKVTIRQLLTHTRIDSSRIRWVRGRSPGAHAGAGCHWPAIR
jgi:beta-lactamase family protein